MSSRIVTIVSLATLLLAGPARSQDTHSRNPHAPAALDRYAFKIGQWNLEVRSMRPDQTFITGEGTLRVSWALEGFAVQEDLLVQLEDGSETRGITLRTYDPAADRWHIAYFQANSSTSSGFGTAEMDYGRLVEEWGTATDEHGTYRTTMAHEVLSDDAFRESLDRHYQNGPVIRGVWQYVARRKP